jgi:hypothetical protein
MLGLSDTAQISGLVPTQFPAVCFVWCCLQAEFSLGSNQLGLVVLPMTVFGRASLYMCSCQLMLLATVKHRLLHTCRQQQCVAHHAWQLSVFQRRNTPSLLQQRTYPKCFAFAVQCMCQAKLNPSSRVHSRPCNQASWL